jgi:hypothetical protein
VAKKLDREDPSRTPAALVQSASQSDAKCMVALSYAYRHLASSDTITEFALTIDSREIMPA